MNIQYAEGFDALSEAAASIVLNSVKEKPDLLLCAAAGESPSGLYGRLADHARRNPPLFQRLSVVKLDEWLGVPMSNEHTCDWQLKEQLIRPLHISPRNYIAFDGAAPEPEAECGRVRRRLLEAGPIDLCVLGLGLNGHNGFNEPADSLRPRCHMAALSEASRSHSMARSMGVQVAYGLSLGMADILSSRRILLLAAGKEKSPVIKRLLSEQITTALPASFLWLHPDTTCLIDSTALD